MSVLVSERLTGRGEVAHSGGGPLGALTHSITFQPQTAPLGAIRRAACPTLLMKEQLICHAQGSTLGRAE